ncbi:hypothetical protein [Silvibacterium acidisoli]|uniref:hypothetical protein n=1 Tax=Acidobacteriaceae bacterium ZG23-2 TaxID=2883246 RepID=UPI00406C5B6B
MSLTKRTSKAISLLLQTGVIGISSALAAVPAHASETTTNAVPVADRLSEIRQAVSTSLHDQPGLPGTDKDGPKLMLASWLNFGGGWGWRNGGWRNWHNGGWGNGGWHNGGWGNGGWGNGGWGNGWHNFWHNW